MEQPAEQIKFAIVGYGHIGKRYASILAKNTDAALVAIVDVVALNQTDIPNIMLFPSLEALLQSNIAVDIIVIATPNGLHAAQAISCLKSGKHVVIEKPVALNTADANEIYKVAATHKKEVFPVFQNRFAHSSVWLKEVLSAKKLGEIYMVQFNCFWNRDERYYQPNSWHGSKVMDGGSLFTQFSHFIDTLHWFFGDLEQVKANLSNCANRQNVEFEDSGVVTFDLKSGGQGSLQFTTAVWDKNLESTITVIAQNGTIKIGGQYLDEVIYCHAKEVFVPTFDALKVSNHQKLVEDIIYRLKNHKSASISKEEVLAVIDVIEQIYAVK